MTSPKNVINYICDLLPISLPLVVFVGAGVSHERGKKSVPLTSLKIADYLLSKLKDNGKNKSAQPLKISAQYFLMHRDEKILCETVSQYIKDNSQEIPNNHQLIVELIKKQMDLLKQKTKKVDYDFDVNGNLEVSNKILIITTNYDLLLERCLLINEFFNFTRVIQNFSAKEKYLSICNYNKLNKTDRSKIKSSLKNWDIIDKIIASQKLMTPVSCKEFNKLTDFGKIILYKFHGSIDLQTSKFQYLTDGQFLDILKVISVSF